MGPIFKIGLPSTIRSHFVSSHAALAPENAGEDEASPATTFDKARCHAVRRGADAEASGARVLDLAEIARAFYYIAKTAKVASRDAATHMRMVYHMTLYYLGNTI